MAELLPCPRCGAAATTIEAYVGDRRCPTYTVRCNNIRCEMEGSWGDTREDAEQWWNARTPCPDCAGKDAEIARLSLKLAPKFELEHMIAEQQRIDRFNALMAENTALRAVAEAIPRALAAYELMRKNVVAYGGGLRTEGFVKDCDDAMDALSSAVSSLAALDGEA